MYHRRVFQLMLGSLVLLTAAGVAQATSYTNFSNIAVFTGQVSQYATFSNFSAGDVSSPFTPTSTELANDGFRVYAGGPLLGLPGSNWILASFAAPVSQILVFPNIDHLGAAYDGYQYSIYGSNDKTTWTPLLFDALTVTGSSEPFTLGAFAGIAPSTVNNVLTPGGLDGSVVGYEAAFTFNTANQFYAFGASTVAVTQGNQDQELSAVGAVRTPEAGTLLLLGSGLAALAGWRRYKAA